MKIEGLDNFISHARKQFPNEAAGFLFSKNLYSPQEEWLILPVGNISESPQDSWFPDKKDMLKAKKEATNKGFIKIGNIHTHPCPVGTFDDWEQLVQPSDKDLMFARKFNDIVRIILLLDKTALLACFVHDKFGNEIKVMLHDKVCGDHD